MATAFDPYHKWLGIPPHEQPPNHYRLLGIQLFESDPDTIDNAASSRMIHLRTFQTGPNAVHSERLLNDVAAAKVCLLNPAKKAAYDERLRTHLASRPVAVPASRAAPPLTPHGSPPPPPPESTSVPFVLGPPSSPTKPRHKATGLPTAAIVLIVALGVTALAVGILMSGGGDKKASEVASRPPVGKEKGTTSPSTSDDRPGKSESPGQASAQQGGIGRLVVPLAGASPKDIAVELANENGKAVDMAGVPVKQNANALVYDLPSGSYRLKLVREGYRPHQEEIDLRKDEAARASPVWQASEEQAGFGLCGEYYQGTFAKRVLARVDETVQFIWDSAAPGEGVPADAFSVRWKGFLKSPRPGSYNLSLDAGGTMSVWLDDRPVLRSRDAPAAADVQLTGRPQSLKVEYEKHSGRAYAVLNWAKDGEFVEQAIPPGALFRDAGTASRSAVLETALRKVSAEVDTLDDGPGPRDLLKAVDPRHQAASGLWWFKGATLLGACRAAAPGEQTGLRVPVVYGEEYSLTADVERCSGEDLFQVTFVAGESVMQLTLDAAAKLGGNWSLARLDGRSATVLAQGQGVLLRRGEPQSIRCNVHHDGVSVKVGDRPLCDWHGDLHPPSPSALEGVRLPEYLLVGGKDSLVRIHRLEYVPGSGEDASPDKPEKIGQMADDAKGPGAEENPGDVKTPGAVGKRPLGWFDGRRHKEEFLKLYGGGEDTEAAVERALEWFDKHQLPDGGWSFDHTIATNGDGSGGGHAVKARNAATALAMLAFLGAGHTHKQGPYKKTLTRGLAFLGHSGSIKKAGLSFREDDGTMYSHGMVLLALGEMLALTKDRAIAKPAMAAAGFTLAAQDPKGGGWRYRERERGDTSLTAWQVASLRTYFTAVDKELPASTATLAGAYLNSVQGDGGARYGYTAPPDGNAPPTTAAGLATRIYLGWNANNAALRRGVEMLDTTGPDWANLYYTYYATQVMRHCGGEPWSRWNRAMKPLFLGQQEKQGVEAGSWYSPSDAWTSHGGRLMDTAFITLILESYYRHLSPSDMGVAKK